MPFQTVSLDRIPTDQAKLFAEFLVLAVSKTPFAARSERLAQLYDIFDHKLLRQSFISRLISGDQSKHTALCASHQPFNAVLIHSLFVLLGKEVKSQLYALSQARGQLVDIEVSESTFFSLTAWHEVLDRSANTTPIFQGPLSIFVGKDASGKWRGGSSLCEACVISRIVSDAEVLLQLWTSVRRRGPDPNTQSTKHRIPRLSRWLRCWLDMYIQQQARMGKEEIATDRVREAENNAKLLKLSRKNHSHAMLPQSQSVEVSTFPTSMTDGIVEFPRNTARSQQRVHDGFDVSNKEHATVPLLLDLTDFVDTQVDRQVRIAKNDKDEGMWSNSSEHVSSADHRAGSHDCRYDVSCRTSVATSLIIRCSTNERTMKQQSPAIRPAFSPGIWSAGFSTGSVWTDVTISASQYEMM